MTHTPILMKDIKDRLSRGEITEHLLSRFLDYVRTWTTSDRHVTDTPSTQGQWDLAKKLMGELSSLGITDVELTDHCYVIGRLPASPGCEAAPVIGLLAHLDTASDVSGKDVNPQVLVDWDGSVIPLSENISLDPVEFPELAPRIGDTIICTDGTTLLGADDKAGIAEIVTAVEYLFAHPEIPHGPLEIIFTPDEETGKGLPCFPSDKVRAVACYTLDGGPAGELEAECFTAYKADVTFYGKVIHLGVARGKMANAVSMAASYLAMLPRNESPEATDGYYGYYCPVEIKGDLEKAWVEIYLRDFDASGMQRRVAALSAFARAVESQFPGGRVEVTPTAQYLNMKGKLDQAPHVLDLLEQAADAAKVAHYLKPIRGGTDGSRLTEMGIPTPNIFTGGHNYHSRFEWASLSEMEAAVETLVQLVRLWSDRR